MFDCVDSVFFVKCGFLQLFYLVDFVGVKFIEFDICVQGIGMYVGWFFGGN